MPHIRSADAPSFRLPGLAVTGLASPSRGSSENSVWRLQVAAGSPGVPHSMDREEIIVALSGRALATVGTEVHELEPGDALIVPNGEMFRLANSGDEEFTAVAMASASMLAYMPGGEGFQPPWVK